MELDRSAKWDPIAGKIVGTGSTLVHSSFYTGCIYIGLTPRKLKIKSSTSTVLQQKS
jgi:hypothetical protein